jgi:hypothetical protein
MRSFVRRDRRNRDRPLALKRSPEHSRPAVPIRTERRDQVSREVGILESATQQGFAVMLNDPSMPYDNAIEIRGEDCAYGRAKCGAILNAKPEDAAHAWIPFDTGNVAVEEVIPACFLRCEIEDKICQDQGSTRDVKEQMLLEPR